MMKVKEDVMNPGFTKGQKVVASFLQPVTLFRCNPNTNFPNEGETRKIEFSQGTDLIALYFATEFSHAHACQCHYLEIEVDGQMQIAAFDVTKIELSGERG